MGNIPFGKPLVKREKTRIERDTSRVITRAHIPSISRIKKIIKRVLELTEKEAQNILQEVHINFFNRHKNLEFQLEKHFNKVSEYVPINEQLSKTKKMLIGAYFTMEYSIESAALFNPSIVPHPNQKGLPNGSMRFIMSFRATGEGHISSIVFRSGIIENNGSFIFDNVSEFVETPALSHDSFYDKHSFRLKLKEMNSSNETSNRILDQVPNVFTYHDLKISINIVHLDLDFPQDDSTINNIIWLANSNYRIQFEKNSIVSERVIFPVSENESRGIEDARFVQFYNDNGDVTYYATYTAYNGYSILPHLIETKDFLSFNIITLNGKAVQNKGMALFPRKINGQYVMLSRQDGENNHIMFSDNLHFWQETKIIQEPSDPWEFIQLGNCGSPIETSYGWLVLTHGVGPMRQYSIGVILLDLENPEKIIARLQKPLLAPNEEERDGYVPNVVYSCGSMIHNNILIMPYAMSDISSSIAIVDIKDLIACMTHQSTIVSHIS
jgi:predicted GH43/DUF377 family glycosyl hydrolase